MHRYHLDDTICVTPSMFGSYSNLQSRIFSLKFLHFSLETRRKFHTSSVLCSMTGLKIEVVVYAWINPATIIVNCHVGVHMYFFHSTPWYQVIQREKRKPFKSKINVKKTYFLFCAQMSFLKKNFLILKQIFYN